MNTDILRNSSNQNNCQTPTIERYFSESTNKTENPCKATQSDDTGCARCQMNGGLNGKPYADNISFDAGDGQSMYYTSTKKKHPVSMLYEFCTAKKMTAPEFRLVDTVACPQSPSHTIQCTVRQGLKNYCFEGVARNKKEASRLAAIAVYDAINRPNATTCNTPVSLVEIQHNE